MKRLNFKKISLFFPATLSGSEVTDFCIIALTDKTNTVYAPICFFNEKIYTVDYFTCNHHLFSLSDREKALFYGENAEKTVVRIYTDNSYNDFFLSLGNEIIDWNNVTFYTNDLETVFFTEKTTKADLTISALVEDFYSNSEALFAVESDNNLSVDQKKEYHDLFSNNCNVAIAFVNPIAETLVICSKAKSYSLDFKGNNVLPSEITEVIITLDFGSDQKCIFLIINTKSMEFGNITGIKDGRYYAEKLPNDINAWIPLLKETKKRYSRLDNSQLL